MAPGQPKEEAQSGNRNGHIEPSAPSGAQKPQDAPKCSQRSSKKPQRGSNRNPRGPQETPNEDPKRPPKA
eukprot:1938148-Pyramimonas_sp.AAC.1